MLNFKRVTIFFTKVENIIGDLFIWISNLDRIRLDMNNCITHCFNIILKRLHNKSTSKSNNVIDITVITNFVRKRCTRQSVTSINTKLKCFRDSFCFLFRCKILFKFSTKHLTRRLIILMLNEYTSIHQVCVILGMSSKQVEFLD